MQRISSIALTMALLGTFACGESRLDRMRQQLAYDSVGPDEGKTADDVPKIPPHPTRDALAPLLEYLYEADALPDVQEKDENVPEGQDYAITNPGMLAVVNIRSGTSKGEQAKAIIRGVAEADAFAARSDAELYFPEQLQKLRISFSPEDRDLVQSVYSDLRLLDFFASEDADAAINALDGELKTAATELKDEYLGRKDEIWDRWMGVKMFARRVVAYDQPFKPILRRLRKSFDMKEPEQIPWDEAHDPAFENWAKTISDDEKSFIMFTNLPDLKDQIKFRDDTHARWAMEGSPKIPKGVKIKIDPELGFGLHREDLGGGYQEVTFVFSKKLKPNELREAYLRSLLYRQVFTDFATLSAAGGDFEEGQVPDKYDPDYAYCASRMALDAAINDFSDEMPILEGLEAEVKNEEKILSIAIDCILERIPKDINRGTEGDEARPPAMSTRTAFGQMLARFTKVDVDLDNMKADVEKDQDVLDAEAFLKNNPKDR